jgi:hypothetical protein
MIFPLSIKELIPAKFNNNDNQLICEIKRDLSSETGK